MNKVFFWINNDVYHRNGTQNPLYNTYCTSLHVLHREPPLKVLGRIWLFSIWNNPKCLRPLEIVYSFSAGFIDVRFWCLKSIPALQGLNNYQAKKIGSIFLSWKLFFVMFDKFLSAAAYFNTDINWNHFYG